MTAIPYDLLMQIQEGTMEYSYRGVPLLKNPFDLALYPLLLERLRPRTLIEIGSFRGGSALWFADRAPGMRVVSVDLEPPSGVSHPSVTFVRGDAQDLGAVLDPDALERPLLVIEDSDHRSATTAAVLDFFGAVLQSGEYIVVEDGILSDMRVADQYDGGPLRAIHGFLARNRGRFEVDRSYCDYFGSNVTWNVDGYLRRI